MPTGCLYAAHTYTRSVESAHGGRAYDAHVERERCGGAESQSRRVESQSHVEGHLQQRAAHRDTSQSPAGEPEMQSKEHR